MTDKQTIFAPPSPTLCAVCCREPQKVTEQAVFFWCQHSATLAIFYPEQVIWQLVGPLDGRALDRWAKQYGKPPAPPSE